MIIDFNLHPGVTDGHFDVVIIGSGAAGLAVATKLRASGLRLLLLEAGAFKHEPASTSEAFRSADVAPHSHPPTDLYRRRMLGGTTSIWGGRCIFFDKADFEPTLAGDGATWPIAYEDVAQHVPCALRWLDAGENDFHADSVLKKSAASLFKADSDKLSLSELERFSLPTNAWKKFTNVISSSKNLLVVYNCMCVSLTLSEESERIQSIEVCSPSGGSRKAINSTIYVLAAGGIETPRLLMSSNVNKVRAKNDDDLVGRFYMTHIVSDIGVLELKEINSANLGYERDSEGIYVRRLLKLSESVRLKENLLNIIGRPGVPSIGDATHKSGVLSLAYLAKRFIIPEYRARLVSAGDAIETSIAPHIFNIIRDYLILVHFGSNWVIKRNLSKRKIPSLFLDKMLHFPMEFVSEQAPLRRSRVRLSSELDKYGLPRSTVEWFYCDDDITSLRASLKLLQREIEAAEGVSLKIDDGDLANMSTRLRPQGGHHIGTARMGSHFSNSVTDKWGRCWSANNLYICGSAVFPRSSAANPTLTIVALSHRTAEHIEKTFEVK